MKDTDKSMDKTETSTLGSSIEQEVDAAFDAVQAFDPAETSRDNQMSWGEETLELTDAIMPNQTHTNDLSTLPLTSEDDGDEIIELTEVASIEESAEGNLGDDDEILELTEVVQTDQPDTYAFDDIATALDENDSGILELTDMVPPDDALEPAPDDDDILDLTDTVQTDQLGTDAPEVFAAALDENDSDILELTDMVPADDALEPAPDDHDILDLTDAVQTDQPESDTLSDMTATLNIEDIDILEPAELAPTDQVEEAPAEADGIHPDDSVLELTDMVPMDDTPPEITGRVPSAEAEADSAEEDVIDLADILDEQEGGDEGMEGQEKILRLDDILGKRPESGTQPTGETEFSPEYALDSRSDETDTTDAFSTLGIALDEMEDEGFPSVSAQEVEAAVERIILKKYGASIETLIAKAVEKAVTREINSIKRTMLDDDDAAG